MWPKRWNVFHCFFEEPLTGQDTGFRGQDTVGVKAKVPGIASLRDAFYLQHFFYRHDVPNGTGSQIRPKTK